MASPLNDPWMTLIRRDERVQRNVLDRVDTTLWHWVFAFNMRTPYIIDKGLTTYQNPRGKRVIEVIRSLVYKSTPLRMSMWDERLFVAPSEWPEGMDTFRAFGLREPPSPYEAACALLVSPEAAANFWGFKGVPPLSKAVAHWWMAGMPEEAISNLVSGPPTPKGPGTRSLVSRQWVRLIEDYFQATMQSRKFALWALGTNPVPACPNRVTAKIVKQVLNGEKRQKTSNRPENRAWDKFWEHPYIKTQMQTGIRRCPVERTLYRPGVVWPSLQGKIGWTNQEGEVQAELAKTVAWLERRVWKRPKWLRPLTLSEVILEP